MTDQLSLLPLDMRYEIVARTDTSDWEALFPFLDSPVDIGRIALLAERTIEDIFIEAVAADNAFVVRQVIENTDLDPSFPDQEPLFSAIGNGNLEIVSLLLADPRVDPTIEDNGPLQFAVEQGHAEVVRLLLGDERVTPSQQNLDIAIANDYDEVVRVLLEDGRIDPSVGANAALMEAIQRNNISTALVLLQDTRVLDGTILGHTLYNAVNTGNEELVRALLETNSFDQVEKETSALQAIRNGYADVAMEFRNYI